MVIGFQQIQHVCIACVNRSFGNKTNRKTKYKYYVWNRGKNGREKDKRKTKNDVTGLDAERGLQQVEVESWGSW